MQALRIAAYHASIALVLLALVFDILICRVLVYISVLHAIAQIFIQKVQSIRGLIIIASSFIVCPAYTPLFYYIF